MSESATPDPSEATKIVSGDAGVGMLLKAALPAIPGLNALPGIRKHGGEFTGLQLARPPVVLHRDRVERYAAVCGFPVKDTVPVSYPHLLGFPLHMALMSEQGFPTSPMGMVHIENSLTSFRPISVGETLSVSVGVGPGIPHPVGTAFEFHTTVRAGAENESGEAGEAGELVWQSVSTYLRRGPRNPDAVGPSDLPEVPPSGPVFALTSDLGRRYAAVSGDYNPIHLTPLSAKALGFRRHIAHGMWTKARCIAALENRLPDQVRIAVTFKKPVFLPSRVAFGSSPVDAGYGFSLHRAGADTLHLVGRTTAL